MELLLNGRVELEQSLCNLKSHHCERLAGEAKSEASGISHPAYMPEMSDSLAQISQEGNMVSYIYRFFFCW